MPVLPTCAPPGYEILGPIGRGALGQVDLARQLSVDRFVAIKWLDLSSIPNRSQRIAELRREAALMARVSHPNVLTVHGFEVAPDGTPFLVLEYIKSGDLRHVLRERQRLEPAEVKRIVGEICDAVDCLHKNKILHGDLKPENILMQDGETPRVADFGIARPQSQGSRSEGNLTNQAGGTPGYVAPEQRHGLSVDERADQYSIAAIAGELLTGERPQGGGLSLTERNPTLNPGVARVLVRALADSPSQRYPTLSEFRKALDSALEPSVARPIRARFESPWVAIALVGLVLGGLLLRDSRVSNGPQSTGSTVETSTPPVREVHPTQVGRHSAVPEPAAEILVVDTEEPNVETNMEERLIELWAYRLWQAQGSPRDDMGERVALANTVAASDLVRRETAARAKRLWVERGSRVYNDPSRDAQESERNWLDAQAELLGILEGGLPMESAAP